MQIRMLAPPGLDGRHHCELFLPTHRSQLASSHSDEAIPEFGNECILLLL